MTHDQSKEMTPEQLKAQLQDAKTHLAATLKILQRYKDQGVCLKGDDFKPSLLDVDEYESTCKFLEQMESQSEPREPVSEDLQVHGHRLRKHGENLWWESPEGEGMELGRKSLDEIFSKHM